MDAKIVYIVDNILPQSIDELLTTMGKRSKCKIPSRDSISSDVLRDYMVCIKEYRLATSILRTINQYIKEELDTESDQSNFEKKAYNLIIVIKYLSSSKEALDLLHERLDNKINEEFYKAKSKQFVHSKSEDRQTSYRAVVEEFISDIEHAFQTASEYIEERIKDLLKSPKKNIKNDVSIENNNEYYRNMYKN
jgi:lipopolysaccharide export LptBFGC system permease protein LptF